MYRTPAKNTFSQLNRAQTDRKETHTNSKKRKEKNKQKKSKTKPKPSNKRSPRRHYGVCRLLFAASIMPTLTIVATRISKISFVLCCASGAIPLRRTPCILKCDDENVSNKPKKTEEEMVFLKFFVLKNKMFRFSPKYKRTLCDLINWTASARRLQGKKLTHGMEINMIF